MPGTAGGSAQAKGSDSSPPRLRLILAALGTGCRQGELLDRILVNIISLVTIVSGSLGRLVSKLAGLCLIILNSGCVAVLVPLVTIPSSNYVTREYYEGKYERYDIEYRDAVQFTEHRIPRGEHTLYARQFGHDADGTQPVIILMHGFPDSLHIHDRLAPLLADRYWVVSFDFLGWRQSDKPREHDYDTASLYQNLLAVIEFLGVERVSLVVHDASGPPGIDWALNHPGRTDTLILLNTFYHPMDAVVKPEAIETFSTPGVERTVVRTGARLSDIGFRVGCQRQLRRFFLRQRARRHHVARPHPSGDVQSQSVFSTQRSLGRGSAVPNRQRASAEWM